MTSHRTAASFFALPQTFPGFRFENISGAQSGPGLSIVCPLPRCPFRIYQTPALDGLILGRVRLAVFSHSSDDRNFVSAETPLPRLSRSNKTAARVKHAHDDQTLSGLAIPNGISSVASISPARKSA